MLLRFLGYHGNKFQNLKVIKVADYGIHCLLDDDQCLIIKFFRFKTFQRILPNNYLLQIFV